MGQRSLAFEIREVRSDSEFSACVSLQFEVWEFDNRDVVTTEMLKCCLKRGGLVLGAFSTDNRLLGFLFGFPGWIAGLEFHHSHMLAIHPAARNSGMGTSLKLKQRELIRQRIPLVTWTFDPLEARNAHLNFNKLGIVVGHYYIDLYGPNPTSSLHSGIGTDRFLAEWWIREKPGSPCKPLPDGDSAWALEGEDVHQFRTPSQVRLDLNKKNVLAEIPYQIQSLKGRSLEIARQWRSATRQVFTHYLKRDYEVAGFQNSVLETGSRIGFYLLKRPAGPVSGKNRCGIRRG